MVFSHGHINIFVPGRLSLSSFITKSLNHSTKWNDSLFISHPPPSLPALQSAAVAGGGFSPSLSPLFSPSRPTPHRRRLHSENGDASPPPHAATTTAVISRSPSRSGQPPSRRLLSRRAAPSTVAFPSECIAAAAVHAQAAAPASPPRRYYTAGQPPHTLLLLTPFSDNTTTTLYFPNQWMKVVILVVDSGIWNYLY
ncbi:uncharacterized protein LOC125195315 [Salvia hispanica]|uniref:uncharacterized protein LOC125195315 n=1 Tax=Salvia hispanica TaxID=49212 RepID=UPI002009ABFF|nr:uncharacterized protein LOC125195315 [Salvia hispanica]